MKAQKGDFVEIKYVGKLDDGSIFDLNDKEIAKKVGMQGHIHEKTVVCLGERDVVQGLDDFLIDKDIATKLTVVVDAEKGFGKKDPKQIQMIPANKFKEQKINPMPGLKVEIDQYTGVIKSVSGGRVIVDFNHPFAGRILHYEVMMTRKVEDLKEKVSGFLELNFHLHNAELEEKEGVITLRAQFPLEMQPMLETELKRRIPELKSLVVANVKK